MNKNFSIRKKQTLVKLLKDHLQTIGWSADVLGKKVSESGDKLSGRAIRLWLEEYNKVLPSKKKLFSVILTLLDNGCFTTGQELKEAKELLECITKVGISDSEVINKHIADFNSKTLPTANEINQNITILEERITTLESSMKSILEEKKNLQERVESLETQLLNILASLETQINNQQETVITLTEILEDIYLEVDLSIKNS